MFIKFLLGYLIFGLCCVPIIAYMAYTAPSIEDENML